MNWGAFIGGGHREVATTFQLATSLAEANALVHFFLMTTE
jgi:hypothetical protein